MIVIRVELHSAVTERVCRVSELARVVLDNTGGTRTRGNYRCRAYRKGSVASVIREATVMDHARLAEPVMNLVAKALKALGYR